MILGWLPNFNSRSGGWIARDFGLYQRISWSFGDDEDISSSLKVESKVLFKTLMLCCVSSMTFLFIWLDSKLEEGWQEKLTRF